MFCAKVNLFENMVYMQQFHNILLMRILCQVLFVYEKQKPRLGEQLVLHKYYNLI